MELKYTFRSLIELEELTGKSIDQVLGDGSLKAITNLVAVGSKVDFNKACEIIQEEIEAGVGLEAISQNIVQAFTKSGLLGKPQALAGHKKKQAKA